MFPGLNFGESLSCFLYDTLFRSSSCDSDVSLLHYALLRVTLELNTVLKGAARAGVHQVVRVVTSVNAQSKSLRDTTTRKDLSRPKCHTDLERESFSGTTKTVGSQKEKRFPNCNSALLNPVPVHQEVDPVKERLKLGTGCVRGTSPQ